MINLLPYETKKQIRAARTNVGLVRYLVLIGFAIVFLAGISGTVYIVLEQSKASAERITEGNTTKENAYGQVQSEATTFRSDLENVKTVLGQSVSYSNVMIAIAQVLPPGVVIDSLTLSPGTIGVPFVLLAHAKSNDVALQLKTNFASSQYFSNVSLQSLSSAGSSNSNYPIAVAMNITINKVAAQ